MKSSKTKVWRFILSIASVALFASCSDGALPAADETASLGLSAPTPLIISFKANPEEVKAGETATISWEVANADSIEITAKAASGPLQFNVQSKELSGTSEPVALTETTDFTITAKMPPAAPAEGEGGEAAAAMKIKKMKAQEAAPADGAAEGEAPAEASISQTITVKVVAADSMNVAATADKTSIAGGEKTIIHWEVTPVAPATALPEAPTVAVADSAGVVVSPTFAGEDCKKTDAADLLATGSPTEAPQASGCAVVDPEATATYKVVATLASGETKEASVTVEVAAPAPSSVVAKFLLNGEAQTAIASLDQEVNVSWTVEPANAVVSITADPPVTCNYPLPMAAEAAANPGDAANYADEAAPALPLNYVYSLSCKLSALPTTFTFNAKVPSEAGATTVVAGVTQAQ